MATHSALNAPLLPATKTRAIEAETPGRASPKVDSQAANEATNLSRAISVSLLLMMVEIVGGLLANSLAIVTDAMHLLSDVGGFALSLLALRVMRQPATAKYSYGFQQAGALGGLLSVLVVWLMAGALLVQACHRMVTPEVVNGPLMSGIAILGFLANVTIMLVLGHEHHHGGGGGHGHGHGHGHSHGHSHGHDDEEEEEEEEHGGHGGHGHSEHGGGSGHGHGEHGHSEHGGGSGHGHGEHGHSEHGSGSGHGHGEHGHGEHGGGSGHGHGEHGHKEHGHGEKGHGHGDHHGHGGHGHNGHAGHEGHKSSHGDVEKGHSHGSAAPKSTGKPKPARSVLMNAAIVHVIGDMVQSIGVIIAGLLIWLEPFDIGHTKSGLSNWCYADPLCTLLFSILVIGTTISTIQQAIGQVMMSVPEHIKPQSVKRAIMDLPDVLSVHDLHIWQIGNSLICTGHVTIAEAGKAMKVLENLTHLAQDKFQIGHATFQLEVDGEFDHGIEKLKLGDTSCHEHLCNDGAQCKTY